MATTYVTTATTLTITGGTITFDDIVANTLASEFGLFSEAGGQVYLSFLDIVLHNVTLISNNATVVFRSSTANPRIRLTGASSWTDGAVNTAGGTFGGSTLVFNADEIDDTAWHFINDINTTAILNGTTFKFVGTRSSANPILLHFTRSDPATRFRNVTIDASGITNTTHNVRLVIDIIQRAEIDFHTIGLVDVRRVLAGATDSQSLVSLSYSRPNSVMADFTASDVIDTILRNLTANTEDGVVIHVPDGTELTLLNPNITSDDIRVINTSATGFVNIAEEIITQVVDRDNGNPVAGALVRYQNATGTQLGTFGTSDTEGNTPSQRLRVFRGNGSGIATAQPITQVADTYIRARVRAYHYLDTQDLLYDVGLRHIQATMVRDDAVTLSLADASGFVGLDYDGSIDVFTLSVEDNISDIYSRMKFQHSAVYNDENTTNTLSFIDNILDLGGYGLTVTGGGRILANNVEEAINLRGHVLATNAHQTISSRVAPYVYSDTLATIRVWKDDQPAGNHSYRVSYVDMNTTNIVVLHDVGELADTQHGTGFEYNNYIYPRGSEVTVRWMGIRGLPVHETANNVPEELIHEVITTPQEQSIVMPTTITGRVSLNNYADALEARATWSFDNATRTLTINGDTNVRVHEIVAYLQRYHYENLHHSDTYVLQYDGTNADLGDINLEIDATTVINDIGKIIIVHDFTIPDNAELQNVLIRNTDGILSQFIFDQDSVRASVIGYSYGATGGFTELFRRDQVPNHYQLFHDHEGLAGLYVYALDHEPQFQLVNINSTHREYFPSRRLPYTSNMTELTNILDDILNNRIVLTRTDTPDTGTIRQLASLTVTFNYPTDQTFSLNRFSALMAILWQREEFFAVELQRQTGQTVVIAENEIILEQFQPRLIAGVTYGDLGTIFFRLADGANDIAFDFGVSSTYNWRPANATGDQISFRGDIFAGALNITSNLSEFDWSIADTTDINNVTHHDQNQILININSSTTYRIVGTAQGHAPILTEFNSDTCDTVHLNFIRNDRDYLATDITAVGNVGITFRVAGAGFALDVVISVNDMTGFEWNIGRFKAFWNQFSRLNQVREAMLAWNTVELVQLTADGIFVDRPHRVQFELADGIDQDFILAFRAGFLDPVINWNRDNAEGHRIRTNLTVVDIIIDNNADVDYTYNIDNGTVFTHGRADDQIVSDRTFINSPNVGQVRLFLPHGHLYKFVLFAIGYVPYVVISEGEPIIVSLIRRAFNLRRRPSEYITTQMNDDNLRFGKEGNIFYVDLRGRYTTDTLEALLYILEQEQSYREVILSSPDSVVGNYQPRRLVLSDFFRLRAIDITTRTEVLAQVSINGSGNVANADILDATIIVNHGITRIGLEIPATNVMFSYDLDGTNITTGSANAQQRMDDGQITVMACDIVTVLQRMTLIVVTSDDHEPKVFRIRTAPTTDVLSQLTPANLFTATLPTGHAMGVEYDMTENRLIVTFMNVNPVDYSLEQFYELTKLMHNTSAYRELLIRNNINRLVEFGSDNVKIRHDNLLYFRVLNDIGVNLNFFMEAGYTPTLSGGMYTAPIINRLSFSVTVPEIDNMRVSKMVVSNCVIQIFTEPTDTFSNFVTGGEETNVYVFGDNIYPLGTAFGEADETDITLNPIELPVFYTSTDLAYIDSLVNANEVAFIYDEDTTEFIIRFSPLQDLLLRIGQVHALIARAMQTDAFIRAVTFNDDVGLIVQQNTSFMFLSDSKVLFTLDTSTNPLISVTLDMNVISDYTVNPLIDGRQINLRAIEGGGTCATTAQLNQLEERLTEVINTDRDSIIKLL